MGLLRISKIAGENNNDNKILTDRLISINNIWIEEFTFKIELLDIKHLDWNFDFGYLSTMVI